LGVNAQAKEEAARAAKQSEKEVKEREKKAWKRVKVREEESGHVVAIFQSCG
jgi:hypothetical protein